MTTTDTLLQLDDSTAVGAVGLFPGEPEPATLRPFRCTTHRSPSMWSLSGEQPSHADRIEQQDGEEGSPPTARPSRVPFVHEPVMRAEIVEVFEPVSEGTIVDATLGAGGHAEALLERYPGISVIGLDRDSDAIAAATERLSRFQNRFTAHRVRFDEIPAVVGGRLVDGVLFDLGVSSPQLDRADRGFSHRHDGPLDMRMDDRDSRTASDVVNGYAESDLARLMRRNADEPNARRIAKAIVANRPILTTTELARTVTHALPAAVRRQLRNPATRTFQAIRIEVNDELDVLEPALSNAVGSLRAGGRLAVLAYHSGEDRIVKRLMRDESRTSPAERPDLPLAPGSITRLRLLWNGARKPAADELATNRRSSSARFRAAERTDQEL